MTRSLSAQVSVHLRRPASLLKSRERACLSSKTQFQAASPTHSASDGASWDVGLYHVGDAPQVSTPALRLPHRRAHMESNAAGYTVSCCPATARRYHPFQAARADAWRHYMERRRRPGTARPTTALGRLRVEPTRSAFVAHAMIVHHYISVILRGEGQIARMIEERIRATGGEICLCQDRRRHPHDNGRAGRSRH